MVIEEINRELKELKEMGVTEINGQPIEEYKDSLITKIELEQKEEYDNIALNHTLKELQEKIAFLESKLETPTKFTQGCTNEKAINYNPDANIDDGSCLILGYNSSHIKFGDFNNSQELYFLATVTLQLLAYHLAMAVGFDPNKRQHLINDKLRFRVSRKLTRRHLLSDSN